MLVGYESFSLSFAFLCPFSSLLLSLSPSLALSLSLSHTHTHTPSLSLSHSLSLTLSLSYSLSLSFLSLSPPHFSLSFSLSLSFLSFSPLSLSFWGMARWSELALALDFTLRWLPAIVLLFVLADRRGADTRPRLRLWC